MYFLYRLYRHFDDVWEGRFQKGRFSHSDLFLIFLVLFILESAIELIGATMLLKFVMRIQ